MRKSWFSKWMTGLAVCAAVWFGLQPFEGQAAEWKYEEIMATKVEFVPIEGVIYKDYSDTYIIGKDSKMELRVTFAEPITRVSGTPELSLMAHAGETVKAVMDRREGNSVIVFRFQIGHLRQTTSGQFSRTEVMNLGHFIVTRTEIDPDFKTPKQVEKRIDVINFNGVSRMPKIIYRNEAPQMKLTPTPQQIATDKVSHGFTGDYLLVDINDKVLDPWDFRMRYAMDGRDWTDWFIAKDRNQIPIPPEFKNQSFSVVVHIEDLLGNSWAWTHHYGERGGSGPGKVWVAQELTMAALNLDDFSQMMQEFEARREWFHKDYWLNFKDTAYPSYDDIAVFLFMQTGPNYMSGHTGTAADIDIENSGYQWSPYRDRLDPDRPIQKFKNYMRATQYVRGWGYKEGYWAHIPFGEDGIEEDGRYYLHLYLKDAVEGGAQSRILYHLPEEYLPEDELPDEFDRFVTLWRDNTPPNISFREVAPSVLEITLEDPYRGVRRAQLGISLDSGDTEDEGVWKGWNSTYWYDLFPDRSPAIDSIDVVSSVGDKKVVFTINVDRLPVVRNLPDDATFYLHIRTDDKFQTDSDWSLWGLGQIAYTSRKMSKRGLVSGTPPNVSIQYSEMGPTNQPVDATIVLPPGYKVINNGESNTYTFEDNGEFTFRVWSKDGHEFEYTARVDNIDKEPPVITLDGPATYSLYQGLAFDFVEPGYSAWDNVDGDVTAQVEVDASKINVYRGGYYEIVYTVKDRAGNIAREVRGISVYDNEGISLMLNGELVRNGQMLPAGLLKFDIVGLQSEEFRMLYLPGKQRLGAFKEGGIPIAGKQVNLTQPGWYTFFVQDENRTTAIVQVELR